MHDVATTAAAAATEPASESEHAAAPGTHHESPEHEISSLRAVFRERRISLRTMDRPLRLATGAALASLLGVALLIALRDIPAPNVVLGRSGGQVVEVSAPLFIATLALLALGLAYLVTGAILASWLVALATLVLITAVIGLIDVGISFAVLLCLLIALAVIGRRWPARLVATVLLLGLTTSLTVLYFADSLGRALVGEGTRWPYVSKYGLLTGFGALGLLAVAATVGWAPARRRRLLVGLTGLLAATWALEGMDLLYDSALRASRVSVWAAVTVLVAVAWDVTMSGESLTNHGTRHAPRASRVLAFLGYVVLLAATVLFYSAQRAVGSGKATEAFFEPESVTRDGLFRIALPVAVLLFLLRFGRSSSSVSTLPMETE